MTDQPSDPEQKGVPEDIATLYSRAQIQGNRYWDFSASRKEVRSQFRHRAGNAAAESPVKSARVKQEPAPVKQRTPVSPAAPRPAVPAPPFQAALTETPVHTMVARAAEPQPESAAPCSPAPPSPMQPVVNPGVRWHAMHAMFALEQAAPSPAQPVDLLNLELRSPVTAVLSLAGGVGKTCLVATLGRALSSMGERLLLADTAACGLLPFYFGSRAFRPGVVRTFTRPGAHLNNHLNKNADNHSNNHANNHSNNASLEERNSPVLLLNLEAELYPGDGGAQDLLLGQLVHDSQHASRVLVDVATASREVMRRLLRLRPTLLVPILPDMSSVASLGALETLLARDGDAGNVFYVLNQFAAGSPFHQDLRKLLQQKLGDRLLPVVLSRSAAVSEALAEGMTVIDYAPGSPAAEDYWQLAGWLRSMAAPAIAGYDGVRWSER